MADFGTGPGLVDAQSIQTHLRILQTVIGRMASNSASAKAWTVGLVSGVLVLASSQRSPGLLLLALVPPVWLGGLDAYYLALERQVRDQYNAFVMKAHDDGIISPDLFLIDVERVNAGLVAKAARSYSVWGFHGLLALFVAAFFLVRVLA